MIRDVSHGAGGGRPPFGWCATTGGGMATFAPVPHEMAILQIVRELRARGMTYEAIAAELNAAGHTTKRGAPWRRNTVFSAARVIRRYGIPADIDTAISAAWDKPATTKGVRRSDI